MAKIKYYYDTEKCKYERIEVKTGDVVLNVLGFVLLSVIFALGLFFLSSSFFPTPNEVLLSSENKTYAHDNNKISQELSQITLLVEELRKRDEEIYRIITESDVPAEVTLSYDTTDYLALAKGPKRCRALVGKNIDKIERLRQLIENQHKSYDDLLERAKEKETLLASIPAIQPISNKQLTRLASGFGMRTHPILKVRRFHKGIDFSAPRGTPIYATGDGVIKVVKSSYGGYGRQVMIDHGFGYETRYGHMQNMFVKKGQKIKRGEQIGTVGNTGASTGPHVHYEVIKNGKVVNPVHYFFKDLDADEYEEILRLASVENQSMS